ncbi:6-pyruvoyl trahydropterin synthase family protein [Lacticaseibacillus jixiensis]|uniref:6-pyruvoyl trahydropterin synthase family protein n=1 Tax=Lacticaseibacillus jixiensis TaxID=3231926 RepID=UPI0036F1ABB0
MQIDKQFKFEAAHCLDGHAGKCNNLHGHSYRFTVTLAGDLIASGSSAGMVCDFGDISRVVKAQVLAKLDHSFIYDRNNANEAQIAELLHQLGKKVYAMDTRSTAEHLCQEIASLIQPQLPALTQVTVYETVSGSASWAVK